MTDNLLPRGWAAVQLSDILLAIVGGGTPSRKVPDYFNGTIPWFTIKDMQSLRPNDAEEHISEAAVRDSATNVIPPNTLIIATRIALGKAIKPIVACAINQDLKALIVGRGIDSDLLLYWVISNAKAIQNLGSGTTVSGIRLETLNTLRLNLPPSAEQIRIVTKLEELLSDLDAGIAELKAAQKKLTQYRQSLLKAAVEGRLTAEWRAKHPLSPNPSPTRGEGNQVVGEGEVESENSTPLPPRGGGAGGEGDKITGETGAQLLEHILAERRRRWEEKQIAKFKEQGKIPPKDWRDKYPEPVNPSTTDLPELPEGWVWASIEQIASDEPYSLAIGPFGSNLKALDYRDAGVPLVFVRNIRSRKYNGINTRYVTVQKAEELSAHRIQAEDVLITKMGEPPGDADVYPSDQPPAIITADCIKVRCWQGFMQAHFLAAVINSHIGKQQIEPITQGVAQKKVSLGRFSSLAVPVPSMEEQGKIIEFLAAGDREAMAQEAAILRALKQSSAQRQNILKAAFSGQLVPQDPNDEPASVLLERIRAERAARESGGKRRGRKAKGDAA